MVERARGINRRERGIPLLLAVDFAGFAVLVLAYLVLRFTGPAWPHPLHFPSGLMTVAMIMFGAATSFVVRVAARSGTKADLATTQRMLALAVVGWATFLFLLTLEWTRMYFFEHVALLSNPSGASAVGICYYGLTGYQAAQVLVGLVWLTKAAVHPERWRMSTLAMLVDTVNAMFIVLAFVLLFPSMDLYGF